MAPDSSVHTIRIPPLLAAVLCMDGMSLLLSPHLDAHATAPSDFFLKISDFIVLRV